MNKIEMKKILVVVFLLVSCTLLGAEINEGLVRKDITPPLPFGLTDYGFPGPFADNVKDKVYSEICHVMNFTGTMAKKKVFKLATFSSDATPPIGHMLLTGGHKKAESIEGPLEVRGFVLLPPNEKPLVFCSVDWADIRNEAYRRWCDVLSEAAGNRPVQDYAMRGTPTRYSSCRS